MTNSERVAPFLLVVVAVVWGTTFFIVKDAVTQIDPYLLVLVRSFLACIPLFGILLLRKPKTLLVKRTILDGAILGFLLAVMYSSQTIGLQYTSSGHSAFVTGVAVVLVPLVMFVLYRYKFRWFQLGSILLVAIGLYLLTYDAKTQVNIGDLITLVTALTAALHIVFVGKMARRNDILALVAYQFLFSGIFNAIAHQSLAANPWHILPQSWPALIYLGLVGTLFCYGISSWAQRFVNPVAAGLIFSLEPVFAAFFSYWFAQEILKPAEIFGATLILSGIILYEIPLKRIFQQLVYKNQINKA
jgi:drug/metabolite transporter (DMT)-like permease